MDNFLGRNDEQMQCRGVLHIVEYGDTLYTIGKKYGVPLSRVMYANPYVDVYNLQAGDEICVPVMAPRMPAESSKREPVQGNRREGAMEPVQGNYRENTMPPAVEGGQMQRNEPENSLSGNMPFMERNEPEGNRPEGMPPLMEGNRPGGMPPRMEGNRTGGMLPQMENNRPEGMPQNTQENVTGAVPPRMEGNEAEDTLPPMLGMCPKQVCPKGSGIMPWENTGVDDQMVEEYLKGAPEQDSVW